ncbi:MAG TPA: phosphohistidine phosphatase SixA [Opitutaceae bacterium]|nr:phosphohistidine phosphatase SixA [Opitutaceae bacterium]
MKVFLARHGHALAEGDDARRALSARGREVTVSVATFLRTSGALGMVRAVWHSPLLRARETAEVFIKELGVDAPLIETPGLLPEDDAVAVADRLERANDAVLIVGHEPQLSALATLLVRGKVKPAGFVFKKSAMLALETTGGRHKKSGRTRWCACWHFSPELLAAGDAD